MIGGFDCWVLTAGIAVADCSDERRVDLEGGIRIGADGGMLGFAILSAA